MKVGLDWTTIYEAIGYSIGAAQIASYDSRIICITGDGCTFMHGSEI